MSSSLKLDLSHTPENRKAGIRLICLASLAFSLMALTVKTLIRTLPPLEVVFFRSLLGLVLTGAVMFRKQISFLGKPGFRKLHLTRAVFGFISLSVHFWSIALLPLGVAILLGYTASIFVAIFAIVLLKERPGPVLIGMILLAFLGVYLLVEAEIKGVPLQGLSNFFFLTRGGLGIFLGLLSAVTAAVVVLTIRKIGEQESPYTIIFYFVALSTVGSFFYLFLGFEWPNLTEWCLLLGIGLFSFFGQVWMTTAYAKAPASLVSPLTALVPLLSFLYGFVFWGETLTAVSLSGAVLVILAGAVISVFEAKRGIVAEPPGT